MDALTIALVGALSAAVSATITLLLQTFLTKRIEHHFARKLEEHKAALSTRLSTVQGVVLRRFEAFPKIVELSYRTRNMARDILASPSSPALLEELRSRAKELEDYVFRFRLDLEADHVFVMVHRYKNMVLQFSREAGDALGAPPTPSLHQLFDQIDFTYEEVVRQLSEDATVAQNSGGVSVTSRESG